MNIHTVEISRPLGPRLMRIFCRTQRLFQFSPSEQHNYAWKSLSDYMYAPASARAGAHAVLSSPMYPAPGIQKVTLLHNPSLPGSFYLVVVVNLESLFRQDMTVESFGSFTQERLERCCCAFDRVMASFSDLPSKSLLEWSTRRVDYAVDVRLPGLAPAYVSLMQHASIPRGLMQHEVYDDSFYLRSKGGDVRLNFYSKKAQLLNDKDLCRNDRLLREAQDLLRFEVQCQGHKLLHIHSLVRDQGLPYHGMELRTFLNESIANQIVQDYFRRSIGYGDYYTLSFAEQSLRIQQGRSESKDRSLAFLRQVAHAGSVDAGIEAFRQGVFADGSSAFVCGPMSSLQNLLNGYLPRYGLNPVCLPPDYPANTLPNPMPLHLRLER